jgi:hypothetical protein
MLVYLFYSLKKRSMKKILFSVAFLAANLSFFAQDLTITFESLPLTGAETFYNGADEAGFFQVDNVKFENYYNTEYDFWSGFVYSNVTDNTTPGWLNQYSAYPGSGANNSEKYSVFYDSGSKIDFSEPIHIQSLKLSNTTYTALSMRDGDMYAKKFGGETGNDPDFLKVWIIGYNEDWSPADSVEFYLADYRFENNSEDYIVNTWKTVNFNFVSPIYFLGFKFESSDVSPMGWINTPTYLAIDDVSFNKTVSTSELLAESFQIYPNPSKEYFKVKGGNGMITVRDLTGKVIFEQIHADFSIISIENLSKGTYFVTLETENAQVTKTVVKN